MSSHSNYWLIVPLQGYPTNTPNFERTNVFVAMANLAARALNAWKHEQQIIRDKALRRAVLLGNSE